MKYTIEHILNGEDEIIIRCKENTSHIEQIINLVTGGDKRISATKDGNTVLLERSEIMYVESVDGKTFACTENDVYKLSCTLAQADQALNEINFFRCSKSMIINIDCIKELKSLSSNRIDATMYNGEHIIISRTYASALRKMLRGENNYE